MIPFLRFAGILNAALWCGSSLFLIIALPAVFSDELKTRLGPIGPPGVGWVAQAIMARFFILQYCCGAIALTHLVLEWLYSGKPLLQRNLPLVLALIAFSLAGGLWMQPKLNDLHRTKYSSAPVEIRQQADRAFKAWHGASEFGNLIAITGLLVYLWRITQSSDHARYGTLNLDKFRG